MTVRRRFASVAMAGVTFQAGSSAVDSATIVAALVFQLTGSSILVGAVTTILRIGWLFPQLFVGFLAQRGADSRRYYMIGAFGRALCIGCIAATLFYSADWKAPWLGAAVMTLWTAYAFVSGIVAVPYNDIVARAVPSELRSRLLATRFFGGGVLALGVAYLADRLLAAQMFPVSYAALFAIAAGLMLISSIVFVTMGEPPQAKGSLKIPSFHIYLLEGRKVFVRDKQFRMFVFAQWCGGAVMMAMPFYVVHVAELGFDLQRVAILLGAQTAGGLVSNVLWGWWGDTRGKGSLLQGITFLRILPPFAVLIFSSGAMPIEIDPFVIFAGVFFVLGALANGLTIAVIGFLMDISPEALRPAYSGYFNALTTPAYLFPLIGGVIADSGSAIAIFTISALAAAAQFGLVRSIMRSPVQAGH